MGLLSSRFNRPKSGVIHSNAMASANPGSFGSTSAETFGQRQSIDSSRMHVKNFRHAGVLYSHRDQAFTAKAQAAPSDTPSVRARPGSSAIVRPSFAPPSHRTGPYREPPSRGYNPYT